LDLIGSGSPRDLRIAEERWLPELSDGCLSMIGLVTLRSHRVVRVFSSRSLKWFNAEGSNLCYKTIRQLPEAAKSSVLMSSHSPFVITEVWNGETTSFISVVSRGPRFKSRYKDGSHERRDDRAQAG
jgi:hypothetical protein